MSVGSHFLCYPKQGCRSVFTQFSSQSEAAELLTSQALLVQVCTRDPMRWVRKAAHEALQKQGLGVAIPATSVEECSRLIAERDTWRVPELLSFFERNANVGLCELFMNSGHPTLEQTGQRWAKEHGFQLTFYPSSGGPGKEW